MKYTELTERVNDIIKNKVYLSEAQKDELKPETTMSFFGLDSLDKVELVMEFEKEFNISIPDEDAEKFDDNFSLGDIIDYLANRLDIKENNTSIMTKIVNTVTNNFFGSKPDDNKGQETPKVKYNYKPGDKVEVKSFQWYCKESNNGRNSIRHSDRRLPDVVCAMSNWCGQTLTIKSINEDEYGYEVKENNYIWSDYMFEGTVEENDDNFLFYVQGNDWRGKEVIALLEKHGGRNQDNFFGRGKDKYYFIEPETRVINWIYITSNMCTFLRKFYTELHIDNTEPIFRVGQLIKEKYNDSGSIYEITDISDGCYHCKLEHGAASIPWSLQDNWTIAPIFEVGTQIINIETADIYTLTELKQDADGNYYYIVAEDGTLTISTSEQNMFKLYNCNVEYILQTGDDTCVGRIFKSEDEAKEIAEGLKKYSCNKDAKFSIRRLISK